MIIIGSRLLTSDFRLPASRFKNLFIFAYYTVKLIECTNTNLLFFKIYL
jgi:hypothetical protein